MVLDEGVCSDAVVVGGYRPQSDELLFVSTGACSASVFEPPSSKRLRAAGLAGPSAMGGSHSRRVTGQAVLNTTEHASQSSWAVTVQQATIYFLLARGMFSSRF